MHFTWMHYTWPFLVCKITLLLTKVKLKEFAFTETLHRVHAYTINLYFEQNAVVKRNICKNCILSFILSLSTSCSKLTIECSLTLICEFQTLKNSHVIILYLLYFSSSEGITI